MASKRLISYQVKIFLPIIICLWIIILGMLIWQMSRVREVRDEMALDQMTFTTARMVNAMEKNDTLGAINIAEYSNKYFNDSKYYDQMVIWAQDLNTGEVVARFGNGIEKSFTDLPKHKSGRITIPAEHLSDEFGRDVDFLYVSSIAPSSKVKIYTMLPYTKRLEEVMDSRTTYIWLIFIVLGIVVTVITYIGSVYFNRNLKILKKFASQTSNNPNFEMTEDMVFPHDELGEISREIMRLFMQRSQEIEKREREHKIALNAIVEKDRIKRELTSNLNHELKTPVGVVQGYLDTIVDDPDMPEAKRWEYIVKAQQNAHRLTQLISDIREITKLESGGKLTNITDVNFHEVTFSLENFLEDGNILNGKMTFRYNLPINCMVVANGDMLHNTLLNLIKNSVAYSEGTECYLELVKEDDDFYYFRYYDNGIGVPPEHLPHMFDRFYRVNAGRSRSSGGTGLGLAIVQATINSFGGKIEVNNHFPTGLEFNFKLLKYKKPAIPQDEDK